MSLFLHICTGLGLALAAGIRPFMPALLSGALAADLLLQFFGFAAPLPALVLLAWAWRIAHHDRLIIWLRVGALLLALPAMGGPTSLTPADFMSQWTGNEPLT